MTDYCLSVIIPVYNSQTTVTACLTGIVNQTLKPKEVIVVDDGSTDKTVAKIKNLAKNLPRLKLLTQSHQGPAAARNLAAKKAVGNILVFVDADMEFDPTFLDRLTLPIRKGRAKGTWSGNEWVKNWHNPWVRCLNYEHNRSTAKMVGTDPGQKQVFRAILKTEFDKVHGFDRIGYTDDWTLVNKLGYLPVITTAKFYHHQLDSLPAVFHHALWIGKRRYKLGKFGALVAAFRANAFFSVIIGLYKSFRFFTWRFIIFKLVYDLGILIGALISLTGKQY